MAIISTVLLALSRADPDNYSRDFSAFNGPIAPLFPSYKDNTYIHHICIYYIYGLSGQGAKTGGARSGE